MTRRARASRLRAVSLTAGVVAAALLAVAGPASAQQVDFASPEPYNSGGGAPQGITRADFDGDGDVDLAATNRDSNIVTVLLNKGNGGYGAPQSTYSGGSQPWDIVHGDFDGDGDIDLATPNRSSNNVGILLNNGSGSFSLQSPPGTQGNPVGITADDFDGDGDLDLAVVNGEYCEYISIIRNNGGGSFQHVNTYGGNYCSVYSQGITSGDFNRDGRPDLAISAPNRNIILVYYGQGSMSFSGPNAFNSGGGSPRDLYDADFDGDGDQDIAVTNQSSNNVGILLSNGTGSMSLQSTPYSGGSTPFGITGADYDLDGDTDLAVANYNSNNVGILLNQGGGNYGHQNSFSSGGSNPWDVTSSDLDGDGKPDLALTNLSSNNVAVLRNLFNRRPAAQPDSYATDEDTPLTQEAPGVLANDSDEDGDDLTAQLNGGPSNGTVELRPDGSFTYTPNPNFNGQDSFSYVASDGRASSDPVTVTVDVGAVNDDPAAEDDRASTAEDEPVIVDVLANDSDAEGDQITMVRSSDPEHGKAECTDRDCTYTPDPNFAGRDSFTYEVEDGKGGTDMATVTVDVRRVEDAPTAVNDRASTEEDTPVTTNVVANDRDADGDDMTVTDASQPAHGSVDCSGQECTYTPDPNYAGRDSFTYEVSDGRSTDEATVSISVAAVNDAPAARDDRASVRENGEVTMRMLANDRDVDGDQIRIEDASDPAHGEVDCTDSECTYKPDRDYSGNDSFTYEVSDGEGGTDEARVTIEVRPVNDAPDPVNHAPRGGSDSFNGKEDKTMTVRAPGVVTNDIDPDGDRLRADVTSGTNHGRLVLRSDGSFTYRPARNYHGKDSFTYQVSDGKGGTDQVRAKIKLRAVAR